MTPHEEQRERLKRIRTPKKGPHPEAECPNRPEMCPDCVPKGFVAPVSLQMAAGKKPKKAPRPQEPSFRWPDGTGVSKLWKDGRWVCNVFVPGYNGTFSREGTSSFGTERECMHLYRQHLAKQVASEGRTR